MNIEQPKNNKYIWREKLQLRFSLFSYTSKGYKYLVNKLIFLAENQRA